MTMLSAAWNASIARVTGWIVAIAASSAAAAVSACQIVTATWNTSTNSELRRFEDAGRAVQERLVGATIRSAQRGQGRLRKFAVESFGHHVMAVHQRSRRMKDAKLFLFDATRREPDPIDTVAIITSED
ncbi:hypothetical protein [Lysobacter capsici]|uniref:hypothetical protein n=1 Tax=Lysobacter capsici TaxID=435897 RepID=UPI000627AAB7|nr:hypothetical protein [Lysobacter capsici]